MQNATSKPSRYQHFTANPADSNSFSNHWSGNCSFWMQSCRDSHKFVSNSKRNLLRHVYVWGDSLMRCDIWIFSISCLSVFLAYFEWLLNLYLVSLRDNFTCLQKLSLHVALVLPGLGGNSQTKKTFCQIYEVSPRLFPTNFNPLFQGLGACCAHILPIASCRRRPKLGENL